MSARPATHTWRDVVAVLWRHSGKSLCLFAVVLAMTAAYVLFSSREYQSTAKYLVRLGHESVSLDPIASASETIGLYRTSDSVVRSIHDIVRSDDVAHEVIRRIGIDVLLDRDRSLKPGLLTRAKQFVQSMDPISDEERALIVFKENLNVSSPNQSNVVVITYSASDPQLAFEVMRTVSEVFLEEHRRVTHTAGSLDFFVDQNQILADALASASESLRAAKTRHDVSSIDEKRKNLENRLDETRGALLDNEKLVASSNSRSEQLDSLLETLPSSVTLAATSGVDDQASAGMRQQLYDLQIREKELATKYSPDHPLVVSIQKQLQEVLRINADLDAARVETSRGLNPLHQELKLQLLTEQANQASLTTAGRILQQQLDELLRKVAALNQQEMEIYHLTTELEVAGAKYAAHAANLERARMDAALGERDITSINVVQHPRINERPTSPNKKLSVILGLLVACAGAFCLPFGIEYLRDVPPARIGHTDFSSDADVRRSALRSPADDDYIAEPREWESIQA